MSKETAESFAHRFSVGYLLFYNNEAQNFPRIFGALNWTARLFSKRDGDRDGGKGATR